METLKTKFGDLDPEAARDALAKVGSDDWDPDKKLAQHKRDFESRIRKDYEAKLRSSNTDYGAKVKMLTDQRDVGRSQLVKELITNRISRGLSAPDGPQGSEKVLGPIIRQYLKGTFSDAGEVSIGIIDGDGQPRFTTASGGQVPMTVGDLIGEMANDADFQPYFSKAGANASGGGSGPPNRPGTTDAGSRTPYTISHADARDVPRYQAACAEAEKQGREVQIVDSPYS